MKVNHGRCRTGNLKPDNKTNGVVVSVWAILVISNEIDFSRAAKDTSIWPNTVRGTQIAMRKTNYVFLFPLCPKEFINVS